MTSRVTLGTTSPTRHGGRHGEEVPCDPRGRRANPTASAHLCRPCRGEEAGPRAGAALGRRGRGPRPRAAGALCLCVRTVGRGRRRSLRPPAERVVGPQVAGHACHETVRQAPQKYEVKPHPRTVWCIPPKQSGEFVHHVEDVPAAHHRPRGPRCPAACVGGTFKQLIGGVRRPRPALPARPGDVGRCDGVCVRNGVAGVFMASEPPAARRSTSRPSCGNCSAAAAPRPSGSCRWWTG